MKKAVPDFSGKVVQVSIEGDSYAFAIDRPRFELQYGRLFLVGIVPHGTSQGDWSMGAGCGVAWDSVTDYLVFDSLEHYQKALTKFEKDKSKRKS